MFASRPLVEEIPNSASISAPGWAYVPDVGVDPVKAGHRPANRKRTARVSAIGGAAASSRQEAARLRKLAELDRDNARDVAISLPNRGKERTKGKTPNTRKILAAQKTLANYLADEEAWAAQESFFPVAARAPASIQRTASNTAKRPNSSHVKRESASRPQTASGSSTKGKDASSKDVEMTDADQGPGPNTADGVTPPVSHESSLPLSSSQSQSQGPPPAANPFWKPAPASAPLSPEEQRLLVVNTPHAPTDEEMERLTNAPPLGFAASRAVLTDRQIQPQRFFCELCGYWARQRCALCAGRLCGTLECKAGHDEGRCVKYGA